MHKGKTPRVIERKYGNVIRTNIELMTNQWHRLNECVSRFKLTKSDIVAQALQMWFNSVDNKGGQ